MRLTKHYQMQTKKGTMIYNFMQKINHHIMYTHNKIDLILSPKTKGPMKKESNKQKRKDGTF